MKHIDCVIFDLDGTIADTIPMIVQCFEEVFEKYVSKKYSASDIVAMFGPTERGIIARQVPRKKVDDAVEYYYENYPHLLFSKARLFDGVDSMLSKLQSLGKRLAIATGKGKRSASMTLLGLGVQPYFSVVVTGDDVREPKPSPKILTETVHRIGTIPEHTLYVGDAPVDIVCGRRSGVLAGAALWGAADREGLLDMQPDFVFKHPNDIVGNVQHAFLVRR